MRAIFRRLSLGTRRCFIQAGACFGLDEKLADMIKPEFQGTLESSFLFGLVFFKIVLQCYKDIVNKSHLCAMLMLHYTNM